MKRSLLLRALLLLAGAVVIPACGRSQPATTILLAPSAPSGVSAVSGESLSTLSWTSSGGASHYNVKRSLATGGPYTTIASVTGVTFTDSGLADGTQYFYVVSSVNNVGEGGNSSEVVIIPAQATAIAAAPGGVVGTAGDQQVVLSWSASTGAASYNVKSSASVGGPYVTVTNVTGTTFTSGVLPNGTAVFYEVTAVNSLGESAPSAPPVSATPTAPGAAPAAPGLSALPGDTQITLTWTASAGADTYTLHRGTVAGGPYGTVVSNSLTGTSFTDLGLANGTHYFYVMTAVNSVGASSNSNEASAIPVAPPTAPSAPMALTATGGNAKVALSWTGSTGATTYTLLRGTVNGGPYGTTVSSAITTTFFTDNSGLANGTPYYYVVKAVNTTGPSANSNQATATPTAPPLPPSVPTSLVATADTTPKVALAWTASGGATSYVVRRSASGAGPFTVIASPVTNSYNDVSVASNTAYFYEVAAINIGGASAYSTPAASATTPSLAPTGLTAVQDNTPQIVLNWTASAGAVTYNIKRAVGAGAFAQYQNLGATTYSDVTVANNTAYSYQITAINAGGVESLVSATATATTPPAAPTGLSATADTTPQVVLAWTGAAGATSYNIKRALGAGAFAQYATSGAAAYNDVGVASNTAYRYEVTAVSAAGESLVSNISAATTPSLAPTGLSAVSDNVPQINLTWSASTGALTYNVKRAVGAGAFVQYANTAGLGFTDIGGGVVNNQAYSYQVTAINAGGVESLVSNTATATTPPVAPVIATTVQNSPPGVTFTWTAVPGATSYSLWRSATSGTETVLPAAIGAGATSFSDTTVAFNTKYFYFLVAAGVGGNSKNSNEVSPTVPPAAPTSLVATSTNAPQVNLTWTAPAGGAVSYKVFRVGTVPPLATGVGLTNFADSTVNDNTSYQYTVVATNVGGDSVSSNTASVTTPPAPPVISVVLNSSIPQATLTWASVPGATGYNILRGISSNGEVQIATAPGGATSYPDASLNNNNQTFYYKVQATNAGLGLVSRNSNEAVALIPPSVPTGFSATPSASPFQVALAWTAPANGAAGYDIFRSSGGPFGKINGSPVLVTNFNDSTIVNATTFTYNVVAVNGSGNSPATGNVSATAPTTAPTGLAAVSGSSSVNLSWNPTAGAASYNVYRSPNPPGVFALLMSTGAVTFSDSTVAPATLYNYRITAVASGPNTVESLASATAGPVGSNPALPPAPTLNTLTPGNSQVGVAFTSGGGSPTSFNVKRSTTSGGPYATVGTPASSPFTDSSGLSNGTTYFYVVSAVNISGEGSNSNELSTIPNLPPNPPSISSLAVDNSIAIRINWGNIVNASSYDIKRQLNGAGPFNSLGLSLPAGSTTYLDTSLQGNTTFAYIVTAINNIGPTDSPSAGPLLTPPSAPSLTSAVASATPLQVALSWSAPANGAANYQVTRQTNGVGAFTNVGGPTGSLTFNDGTVANNTSYAYKIVALNASPGSPSLNSNSQSATTPTAAPTGLSGTIGNNVVNLTWTSTPGALSYNVKRGLSGGGPFSTSVGSPSTNSFSDTTAVNGTAYFYIVTAVNGGAVESNPSNVAGPLTPNAGPTISSTLPINAATAVPNDTNLVLTFSMPMVQAEVQSHFSFTPATGGIHQFFWDGTSSVLTVVFDTVTPIGTITGDDLLADGTLYTWSISAGAHSQSAQSLPPQSGTFTTKADTTPPQLLTISPDPRFGTLNNVTSFTLTFNEAMDQSTSNGINVQLQGGTDKRQASPGSPDPKMTVSWTNSTHLAITLSPALTANTGYRLQVEQLRDLAGNYMNNGIQYNILIQGSGVAAPFITGNYPVNGSTGVTRDAGIFIGLSEPLEPDVASFFSISGAATPVQIDYKLGKSDGPLGLQVSPLAAWPANTAITVKLLGTVKNASGVALGSDFTFTFTTGATGAGTGGILIDNAFSTLKSAMVDCDTFSGAQGDVLFKDSISGNRVFLDMSTVNNNSISVTDPNGIPVKGFLVNASGNNGGNAGLSMDIRRQGGQGLSNLQFSTTYTLTFKNTIKSSTGATLGLIPYTFTTIASNGLPRPTPSLNNTNTNESPGPNYQVDLQVNMNNGGNNGVGIQSVAAHVGSTTDYVSSNGFIPTWISAGASVTVTGCNNALNNGTFTVSAVSGSGPPFTITLNNANGVLQSSQNGQIGPPTAVTVADITGSGNTFAATLTFNSSNFDYEYSSSGNETGFVTSGDHTLRYTVTDGVGSHTMLIDESIYLFSQADMTALTLTATAPTGGLTPTYTWSGTTPATVTALFVAVLDASTNKELFGWVIPPTQTSFTQPANTPLVLGGSYKWTVGYFHSGNGTIRDNSGGNANLNPISFTR